MWISSAAIACSCHIGGSASWRCDVSNEQTRASGRIVLQRGLYPRCVSACNFTLRRFRNCIHRVPHPARLDDQQSTDGSPVRSQSVRIAKERYYVFSTAVNMQDFEQDFESTLQEAGLKPLLCLPMVAPADILHPIPPALIIGTATTIANGSAGTLLYVMLHT